MTTFGRQLRNSIDRAPPLVPHMSILPDLDVLKSTRDAILSTSAERMAERTPKLKHKLSETNLLEYYRKRVLEAEVPPEAFDTPPSSSKPKRSSPKKLIKSEKQSQSIPDVYKLTLLTFLF